MRGKQFWKRVENDRSNGMSVSGVCKKYHITPDIIQRARYNGLLTDPRKMTSKEATAKRESLRQNPSHVVEVYKDNNNSVRQTLNHFGMSHSGNNRVCIQEILKTQGVVPGSKSRIGESDITPGQFNDACKRATNLTELVQELGLSVHSCNYEKCRRWIQEHSANIDHWIAGSSSRRKFEFNDIFCENSKYPRTMIRTKIMLYNVLDLHECSQCGISEWQGQPLKIQVDHINGNSQDNKIENLRGLCPNCHSLTETFTGKNQRKK